jgi:RNA polymerase sigma-70 factor (ECF subfamily)
MDQGQALIKMRLGDQEIYEEVLQEMLPALYRLAYGITQDSMEAQDAVQDALVSMVRRLGDFQERSSLATWLYRITVNASLDKLRSRRRRGETIPIEEFLPLFTEEGRYAQEVVDWSEAPLERLLSSEAAERIRQAIASLPEEQRVVLVMKDVEDFSLSEISRTLELSLPAVKSRLHRARLALRGVLASYFKERRGSAVTSPKKIKKHKHTCQELVELLCDYLEGDLPQEEKEELDRHMRECPPCMAFLNTYNKTSQICKSLRPEDIPQEMIRRLEAFLQSNKSPTR